MKKLFKIERSTLSIVGGYLVASFMIPALLTAHSCKQQTNKKNQQPGQRSSRVAPAKPGSSFPDTLVIDAASAVFFSPDSIQLEKIRMVNKKSFFESAEHDCYYQMRNAREVLKKNWPRIRIIETSKCRYLLFVKADKSKILVDLDADNDMCGIILFDRIKAPVHIDMMNIDTELGFYFGNGQAPKIRRLKANNS